MTLTDREKEMLKAMIDRGDPLPPRYRSVLFAEPREAELIWPGKTHEVTNTVLPFQSIEQIDEPRAEAAGKGAQEDLFALDAASGRQSGGWTNKLIWGDNKLVLAALKNGPLRREIEKAGGLKLVYIDPPFDVGADFSFDIEIGGEELTKEPSLIEEIAYRDTWGRGRDSFMAMLYERMVLIHDILSEDGALYVHVGPNVSHVARSILDEIFGSERSLNEIIWRRAFAHSDSSRYGIIHDAILFYSKSSRWVWNTIRQAPDRDYINTFFDGYDEERGERYQRISLSASGLSGGGVQLRI